MLSVALVIDRRVVLQEVDDALRKDGLELACGLSPGLVDVLMNICIYSTPRSECQNQYLTLILRYPEVDRRTFTSNIEAFRGLLIPLMPEVGVQSLLDRLVALISVAEPAAPR